MRSNIILPACLCFVVGICRAQDSGYWGSGYNAGGFFTPGAVVAFNRDSGVAFYNPALLAWSSASTATISGTIYRYDKTRVKNGAGTGYNLDDAGWSTIPQMVAGCASLKGMRNISFAYALLREPVINYNMSQRADKYLNALDDSYSAGQENFIGQFSERNNVNSTALQLSAGIQLSPRWSAGITLEGLWRKQDYQLTVNSRAIYAMQGNSQLSPIAEASSQYMADYFQTGMRLKLGLSYNSGRHHLGWLFSSPLWRLGGKATLVSDVEVQNVGGTSGGLNLIGSTRQTGISARHKMPFSVALGYAYDYSKRGQIYIAAEYFGSIGKYNVFTPRNDYFIRPDTGSNNLYTSDLLKMEDAHNGVFNIAMGISCGITPAITGFAVIRSDFSYLSKSLVASSNFLASVADWNTWHAQVGGNFRKRKFNLRAGLMFSYAYTNSHLQKINFDNPSEKNLLQGDVTTTAARKFAAGLLFSYIYNL